MPTAGQIKSYVRKLATSSAKEDKDMLKKIGNDLLVADSSRLDKSYIQWLEELMNGFHKKYLVDLHGALSESAGKMWRSTKARWMYLNTKAKKGEMNLEFFELAQDLGQKIKDLSSTIQLILLHLITSHNFPELLEILLPG